MRLPKRRKRGNRTSKQGPRRIPPGTTYDIDIWYKTRLDAPAGKWEARGFTIFDPKIHDHRAFGRGQLHLSTRGIGDTEAEAIENLRREVQRSCQEHLDELSGDGYGHASVEIEAEAPESVG